MLRCLLFEYLEYERNSLTYWLLTFESSHMQLLFSGGRSSDLLKVKSFHDDEALVTAHEDGKGKYEGQVNESNDKISCSCLLLPPLLLLLFHRLAKTAINDRSGMIILCRILHYSIPN